MHIQQSDTAFEQWLSGVNHGFAYGEPDGVGIYTIPSFSETGLVKHGFTTRKGGVSGGSYQQLNMSWTRTNSTEETIRNYEIASQALGIDPDALVVVHGNHGTNILRADASYKGRGLRSFWKDDEPFFDGLTTNEAGVPVCTIHGDCTPLFVLDPVQKAVCMCHSGWRGTVDGMPTRAIQTMVEAYGSDPSELLIAIGPCIGPCCFEVHEDVAQQFAQNYPRCGCIQPSETQGKYNIDIERVTAWQFYTAGVAARNTTIAGLCTCCNAEQFHSFRRDGRNGGSMAGFMQLVE